LNRPVGGTAASIPPEKVTGAIAVEIAGHRDRPDCGHVAEPAGCRDRRAVRQPDRRIAADVAPQEVGLVVAVEVAGASSDQFVPMLPTPAFDRTVVPFMNQIDVLPLVSRQRMSELLSSVWNFEMS
jgi:hypothetical protein